MNAWQRFWCYVFGWGCPSPPQPPASARNITFTVTDYD